MGTSKDQQFQDKVQIRYPNPKHLQSQRKYSIDDDDNVELPFVYITKMQNIAEVEKLVIYKTALLNKVVVGGKRPDISIRKISVV